MTYAVTDPKVSKSGLKGRTERVRVSSTLTVANLAAAAAGDQLLAVLIPVDATVIDIEFEGYAAGTALQYDIGDTVDPNRYTASSIDGTAAIFWRYTTEVAVAAAHQYTTAVHATEASRVLSVTVETVSSAAEAAGTIWLTVTYIN